MKTLIKYELRLSRKTLLIWMGMVLLLCGFAYFEYLSLRDMMDDLMGLVNSFPEILKITFGVTGDLTTALGWYGCMYFWIATLDFSYAVYLGITCVTKEKERGTAEYLFTKPASRSQIVLAKAEACTLNLLILSTFSGLCNYFTAIVPFGGLKTFPATILGLFLTELVLFSLALLLAALVKSYRGAVRAGTVLLLIFYGLYIAADCLKVPALYYFTPLKYFDVYTVATEGFSLFFLLIAAVLILLSITVAKKVWVSREV